MKQAQKPSISKKIFFLALATLMIVMACDSIDTYNGKSTGQIFLYGENHGVIRILDKQLEIWSDYYHNQNMRHMFIEFPYFFAEFLNVWMQSDNDDILYELYNDWVDGAPWIRNYIEFFRAIKDKFPETIFHGVDVSFAHDPTGIRFLQYLKDNDMQYTERYLLTLKAIEQGKYHEDSGFCHTFRVTSMAENFIRAFDRLGDQNVMGTFGNAHVTLGYRVVGLPDIPTLADRLRERYGDSSVHTTALAWLTMKIDPIRVDTISINNIDYEASYFGTHFDIYRDVVAESVWRLENAYDDFSGKPTYNYWRPLDTYPMVIEINQVIMVDSTLTDGSIRRSFYRSSAGEYMSGIPNGLPSAIRIRFCDED